jgi:hypothetical protein
MMIELILLFWVFASSMVYRGPTKSVHPSYLENYVKICHVLYQGGHIMVTNSTPQLHHQGSHPFANHHMDQGSSDIPL